MKRGLLLLATVTLSSALYAQQVLTPEKARQIIGDFNPQLLERAAQNQEVSQLVDRLVSSYLAQQPLDDLTGKYGLVALARNFDNSIALQAITDVYKEAVLFSELGGEVEPSVRQYAQEQLEKIFSRIWAVSVRTKEELLVAYKQYANSLKRAQTLSDEQRKERVAAAHQALQALQTDLQNLHTNVGTQLVQLAQATLAQAYRQVLEDQTTLRETINLQIKTKHKKPVAE